MGGEIGDGDGIEVKKVSVNIRCSNGMKFVVELSLDSSVESFKSVVAEKCDIPKEEQRLIYKGRILKDDQKTLKSYGLEAEHTVHLVRGFLPAASNNSAGTATTRANITPSVARGVGSIEEGRASLFSTLNEMSGARLPDLAQIQQNSQNPDLMRDIRENLMNNPYIRNMWTSNPQRLSAAAIQTIEAARSFELMRETNRLTRNLESSPAGLNMLRRMYENAQERFLNATMGGDTRIDPSLNPFAVLLGAQGRHDQLNNPTTAGSETTTGSPVPNTNPLPNPWAAGGAGTNQTNATATHPAGTDRSTPPVGLGGLGIPDLEGLLFSTPEPNAISQLMQNPAISQMNQVLGMNNSQVLNPQMIEMLGNPEFIRQMNSPETMQQMTALRQYLFSQLGRQQSTGDVDQTAGGGTGAPAMFNGPGIGGFATPNYSNVPPEERFATQLTQLQEMGFFDTRENLQALAATAGNVHAAVERLLGNPGQQEVSSEP